MKKYIIFALGLLLFLSASGHTQEPPSVRHVLDKEMDYIVKKGDTLWDISEHFYRDPFLWPKLWQQNQYITNPHWIWPGDRIRLYPYRILIREIEPTELAAPPVPGPPLPPPPAAIELVSYPEVSAAGFIVQEMKGIGTVVGAREEKAMLSEADVVYLSFTKDIQVAKGDKFTIFRVEGPVIHPITKKPIGSKVSVRGFVEIIDTKEQVKKGLVLLSFDPIARGDGLKTYLPPLEQLAISAFDKPQYGWIVAAMGGKTKLAEGDIVYIDRGAYDGMRPGHAFDILRRGKWVIDPMSKEKVKLPDEPIGRLVVLTTQERTSAALIITGQVTILMGDEIVGITH